MQVRCFNLSGGGSQTETRQDNVLGQMTRLTAPGQLDRESRFSATANDNKAISQKDYISGEELDDQCDTLGRLSRAETTGAGGWGMSFVYDGWVNRLPQNAIKGSVPTQSILVDPATNRIQSHTYDANGNTTSNPGQGAMTFNVSDRLKTVASDTYSYSPVNQRQWKNNDFTLWGAGGERVLTAQVSLIGSDLRFVQSGFDSYSHGRRLQVTDRLGSVGNYYPYGEAKSGTVSNADSFATYYRDSSALDYAQQRYYRPGSGRFLTTDPLQASADTTAPASWNRSDYSTSDPINRWDPTGMESTASLEAPSCSYLGATGYWCQIVHDTGFGTFTGNGSLSMTLAAAHASAVSAVAVDTVKRAARTIATTLRPSCLSYLGKADLGLKFGQRFLVINEDGTATVDIGANIRHKISNHSIAFKAGPSSSDRHIKKHFEIPGLVTRAYTPFTQNTLYWNPGALCSPVDTISSDAWVLANLLHEIFHLFCFDNYQLQEAFDLGRKNDTDNITEALAITCFI